MRSARGAMDADMTTAAEAVETVLQVYDGLQTMVREDGMPAEALSHTGQAFIIALQAIGYDVVPIAHDELGCVHGCTVGTFCSECPSETASFNTVSAWMKSPWEAPTEDPDR